MNNELPIANSKEHYHKAWELLSEYRQKAFTAVITHGKVKTYTGIEIFSPSEAIDERVEHIKSLLSGMGYSVEGNKNLETITIK